LFPDFAAGQFAHATVRRGEIAAPACLTEITEFYYGLEGRGELWRRQGNVEEIVDILPGRCLSIPPGVSFQYRTDEEELRFIVASAPRWERRFWHDSPLARWPQPAGPPVQGDSSADLPWNTRDVGDPPDYLAPDGSEIRLLLTVPGGGLAHCKLPAGRTTSPVRHKTVEEIWYVTAGSGELWREGQDEPVQLRPGRSVTIPTGFAFQFRTTGEQPLEIVIGTFPAWPGPDEAARASGLWRRGASATLPEPTT
jgi:mannose-6-phosphate isomerase-like protein (cupin superfamily)